MSARTSPAEVRGLFRQVVAAAERAGVDASGWRLDEGESCGVPWRMFDGGYGESRHDFLGNGGFLGRTAREAALSLSGMASALRLVASSREVSR